MKIIVLTTVIILFNVITPIKMEHPTIYSPPQNEPEGYALIIAVPTVDNETLRRKKLLSENEQFDPLPATIQDAELVYAMLQKNGFKSGNIIRLGFNRNDAITEANINEAFETIGNKISRSGSKNNLFVFYYAGHGSRIKDLNGDEKNDDQKDEVLVAHDGYVIDDQVAAIYRKHFRQTRNVMIVDACHAGTIHTIAIGCLSKNNVKAGALNKGLAPSNTAHIKDCHVSDTTGLNDNIPMIYFGASIDEETAADNNGGVFTRAMIKLHKTGEWRNLTPRKLSCKISIAMQEMHPGNQGRIQYGEYGNPSKEFSQQYLFKIK